MTSLTTSHYKLNEKQTTESQTN